MKLKVKPILPVRNLERKVRHEIPHWISTKKLYEKYPNGIIDIEYNYDGFLYYVEQVEPETEEEFEKRLAKYEVELEEYNIWWGENKDAVLQAVLQAEEVKRKKELEKKEKEKAKLEKQLYLLQRKMEELY